MILDLDMLSTLSERSQAWLLIKAEVERRGHWKNKNRGKSGFTALNIQSKDSHQVEWYPYKDSDDSMGGL